MKQKRRDLQGLRALAVAGVVAYHFEIAPFSGGFTGVDVFFVLSGYFIVRMLLDEASSSGRINLARFWGNRIKRLLPNGLLVVIATTIFALLVLPTYRSQAVLEDAVAATLFAANIHFAASAIDYFQIGAPPSPLLHFWSLSVEEQFYLAIPCLMALSLLVKKSAEPRSIFLWLLGCIVIVSFTASIIQLTSNQPAAFYLSPFRAWQLAVGGLIGLRGSSSKRLSAMAGFGAWLGLALILTSYILLSDETIYPGFWAIWPTLGTSLVLIGLDSRTASPLRNALSMKPFERLGDLSYSVYLWHWPVVVFSAAIWPEGGAIATVTGLAVTAILSVVAFRYVERPLHQLSLSTIGLNRTFVAGLSACLLVVIGAVSASALPGRTEQAVNERLEQARNDFGPNYENGCHVAYDDVEQPLCLDGDPENPRVVLFGDSHAAQWYTAVQRATESAGWSLQTWTKTSCPAANVTVWYSPKKAPYDACNAWRTARLSSLLADPPDLVILASSSRYQEWLYDPSTGQQATPDVIDQLWTTGATEVLQALAEAGIATLQIVDTPEMDPGYQDCLSAQAWSSCGREKARALAGLPLAGDGAKLDLTSALCSAEICSPVINGAIAYRDNAHITASFAVTLAPVFRAALEAASASH